MSDEKIKIGIALSGGGIRAAAFHCGVLRWLAENNKLEQVHHISSVSGGSLFAGLIFSVNNMKWPTSHEYLTHVEPEIKNILTHTNLQTSAIINLIKPSNWKYLLSRANVLAKTLIDLWGIKNKLTDLPIEPLWSVNGTTAETGKRFRFKRDKCGDYELGYADAGEFKLADAMAVSAAFPVGIGPLAIHTADFTWMKLKSWDSTESPEQITQDFKKIHIYDGGVYDNLGIEPLYDIGKQELKGEIDHLVVSDAGAPLEKLRLGSSLNPFRAKRIADIALDQTRSLRVRGFVNHIISHPGNGIYLQIGTNPIDKINEFLAKNIQKTSKLLAANWLTEKECNNVAGYPTNLKKLTNDDYDLLSRHGYETAKYNDLLYS